MASSSCSKRDRSGKRHAVSEESVGFCLRIFTREDLKDGKKELPPPAVRKYGDELADHIFLKVPNCEEPWKIELRTSHRRDRMWLEKGWEEFASFYLLDQGDLATFSSIEEPAHFLVRIFSWDDMEVEYPFRGGGAIVSRQKRGVEAEAGSEREARPTSISPRSSADGANVSSPKREETRVEAEARSDMEVDYPIRGGGSNVSRHRHRQKKRETQGEAEARSEPEAWPISSSPKSSADEHENNRSQVSSFISDKPCLSVHIVAASLGARVFINAHFAMEHFCKDGTCCDLTLQNALGDRTWTVQCITYAMSNGRTQAVMSGAGWKSFRQDNHLVAGDFIMLEVIEERKCRVSILRSKT